MKYAIFDKNGFPKAFYSPDVHGERFIQDENGNLILNLECKIPEEAIEITDEQWQEFINNQGKRKWDFENKQVIEHIPSVSLDQLKSQKKQLIKQSFLKTLENGYLTSFGFRVDAKLEDLNNFDILLKYAEMANLDTITIRDYNNIVRTLSIDDFRQLCIELGNFLQNQFQKKWSLQAQIDQASNENELEKIKW